MNLNQVTIPATDVNISVAFYTKLGLHLIVDASPRYVRFELPNGDSTFSIHKVDKVATGNGITIYFEEDNLDKLVAALQKKGFKFTQLPKDETWLWREAHLLDPDGNRLIIYKAGKNRKNPPWRIN